MYITCSCFFLELILRSNSDNISKELVVIQYKYIVYWKTVFGAVMEMFINTWHCGPSVKFREELRALNSEQIYFT
jgi:hypothetical protein